MRQPAADDTAFEQYVLPEIEVLARVANSLTRDHVEAEDHVQDTLLRADRGIAGFDGRQTRTMSARPPVPTRPVVPTARRAP